MKVSAITPSGGRPRTLQLCRRYVERQTYQKICPIEHIVVEDETASISKNLIEAIRRLDSDTEVVVIFEDDDYYHSTWVQWCVDAIQEGYKLVGEGGWRYYHFPTGKYMGQPTTNRSSLCSTAMHIDLVEDLLHVCQTGADQIDTRLWLDVWNRRKGWCRLRRGEGLLVIGMKGLPGRKGYGVGHDPKMYGDHVDLPLDHRPVLREWIGDEDTEVYLREFG